MDVNEEGTDPAAAARGPFMPPYFVLYVLLLCCAFVKPAIEGHHRSGWGKMGTFKKQAYFVCYLHIVNF